MLGKFRTAINQPYQIVSELNKNLTYLNSQCNYNRGGVDVFEKDWDNLVIIDACRYDFFEQLADIDGELMCKISRGSDTSEFLTGNFRDRRLYDTVYVSANPWYLKLKNRLNSDVYSFIKTERNAVKGITTKPSTVTDTAIEAENDYPNKKLIIHYLQPHQPFLGPSAFDINQQASLPETVRANNLERDEVRQLYKENLDIVLESVKRLLSSLSGRSIVIGDHGELLGERETPIPARRYGHPRGVRSDELHKVPWLVVDGDKRRKIIDEGKPENGNQLDESVDEQLDQLGYL